MPKQVLTEKFLRSLLKNPPSKRIPYTEPGRVGFQVRHEPGGAIGFYLRYQRDGREVPMLFGNYPAMSLEQAHEEHAAARKLLSRGLDPIAERNREALARKAEERQARITTAVTIRNVIAEWAWHYARRNRKHPREAVRLLKVYVGKPWNNRSVKELVRRDAVLLLDRIKARAPVLANRIFNLASQAFTFAVARDLLQTNPFLGIERPGGEEEARERTLTTDEIRAFWLALDANDTKMSRPVRLALRLILVTAQRPGEVAGATWSEFDTEAAVWRIPAARAKNARAHDVPLTGLALELLEELRALAKGRPYLLPSFHSTLKEDEPLSQWALSRALRNNRSGDGRLFGRDPFVPHDLRRTAASMMTSLGIARLHVSKVLNHTDKDITGRVYDQHDYFDEKKRALETWAAELQAIIAGKQRKVIPLGRKAG